jgi:hypothetical protein
LRTYWSRWIQSTDRPNAGNYQEMISDSIYCFDIVL